MNMSLRWVFSLLLMTIPLSAIAQEFPAGTAEHQRIILEDWREQSQNVDNIRSVIFKDLPPDEARIVKTIRFSVIGGDRRGDQMIFPVADFDGDERIVTIGQGFIRQLSLFIDEEVYAKLYDKQSQVERHLALVVEQLKENQRRLQNGMPLKKVESGEEYFHWDQATIEKVDETGNKLLAVNLAFILAHEAGHHVLGHTSINRASLTNQQKIVQEEAADNWAIRTIISSGSLPLGAAMSLMMFEEMYKAGINPDHPSNDCRVRAMLVSSINNLDKFSAQLEANGKDVGTLRREWQAGLKQLDDDGECSSASSSSPSQPRGQEALLRLISAASQRRLSRLKGARDPDVADSWAAAPIPGLPLDCTVDYESIDHSFTYGCAKSVGSEESANDLLEQIKATVSSLDGVVDLGDKASGGAHRRVYTLSGVRISVSVLSPRSDSTRQRWLVDLNIFEPTD